MSTNSQGYSNDEWIPKKEPDTLDRLSEEAQKLGDIRKNIQYHEEMTKALKKDEKELVETTIPSLMALRGIASFSTEDLSIDLEEQVFAKIPASKKEAAFAWLRDHNEAGLIKEELVTSVHPQTLKAWVRGKLKEEAELPHDLFGVYIRKVAKVE